MTITAVFFGNPIDFLCPLFVAIIVSSCADEEGGGGGGERKTGTGFAGGRRV